MTDYTITRIDLEAPECQAALAAERAVFENYDLSYQQHFVEMAEPNLRLRVLEIGAGEPVLVVPGGVGDAAMLVQMLAELPGYRFIALNRPGGGLSDGVDHRQVDLRRLAVASIRSVADAFDLERVPIIGNSMGGLWSFWYGLAHPARVSSMVQLGCPALALGTSAPFFMRLMSVPLLNNVIVSLMQPPSPEKALLGLRRMGSTAEDIAQFPEVAAEMAYRFAYLPTYKESWKSLISAVANLGGARTRYVLDAAELRRANWPVQLIWGDNDPFGGLDIAREMEAVLPDARLHVVPAGHLPFADKPADTARAIGQFLSEKTSVSA